MFFSVIYKSKCIKLNMAIIKKYKICIYELTMFYKKTYRKLLKLDIVKFILRLYNAGKRYYK